MAIRLNGVLISYDYEEMINEITEEIREFKEADYSLEYIQVLREEVTEGELYNPIVDYYYTDEVMEDMFILDGSETSSEIKEINNMKKDYYRVKDSLELMKVEDVLNEMKRLDKPVEEYKL